MDYISTEQHKVHVCKLGDIAITTKNETIDTDKDRTVLTSAHFKSDYFNIFLFILKLDTGWLCIALILAYGFGFRRAYTVFHFIY